MSEEQRVIAQTKSHRMHSSGRVESRTVDGMDWQPSWVWDKQDFAALLADAVRRVREEAEQGAMATGRQVRSVDDRVAALETAETDRMGNPLTLRETNERIDNQWHVMSGQADRIEAVDNRLARLEARSHRANDRLDDLDQIGGDYTLLDGRISGLADRVAALEAAAEKRRGISNKRIDWANDLHDKLAARVADIDKRLSTSVHDLDLWCEGNFETINRRLDALESRQQDEDPLLRVNRLVTNIVDMEARQQDEAGEERPRDHNLVSAPTSHFFKEGTAGGYWREEIRREMAREIVERLRRCDGEENDPDLARTGVGPVSLSRVADWIASEYLADDQGKEGG